MKLKIKKFSKFLLDFTNVRFTEFIYRKNVILDIGCGEGEFLIKLANLYPKKQFLGVEIKYGRIIKCLKKSNLNNIKNIKFAICDANLFVEKILLNETLNKVFINNPDPWPKDKHEKNRIIKVPFLNNLHKKLKRRGSLYIKTDSKKYFNYIIKNIKKTKFEIDTSESKFDYSLESTKFQKLYEKDKKRIYSIKFIKK